MRNPDVVIVGGGIAGVSVGHYLARAGNRVLLLEAEPTLAFHTTGRSAAQYLENYGNSVVRRLTIGGRDFFDNPDPDLADGPLWSPRPCLWACHEAQVETLRARFESSRALVPSTEFLDGDAARVVFPVLRPDVAAAMFEPDAMDLDVAAIHQSFVRGLRAAGGEIRTSSPVVDLSPAGDGWSITIGSGSGHDVEQIHTGLVVNAAGAWGDVLGEMAGAKPLGLRPLRRTVAIAALPDGIDEASAASWPLTGFEGGNGSMDAYCKPEPGGLLVSLADETPSEPCDAKPEEVDVALSLARLAEWTTLEIRHVRSTWAGLRSFTADRSPVAGFAPDAPGFFWLIGQGGYGIQMGPGLGRAAAALVEGGDLPADLVEAGLQREDLAADRPGLDDDLALDH